MRNKVLIMAGGTGGHVFPGLEIARIYQEKGTNVHWLGTQAGIEYELVPQNGIQLHIISIAGFRGKKIFQQILAPFRLVHSMWQAWRIMREIKPNLVISMGGYVAAPGGIVAWLMGIPLVIQEQNVIPSSTNKLLSLFAVKIFCGFPNTKFKSQNVITIGNPVRKELLCLPEPRTRCVGQHTPFRLLVIGGSRGAEVLNRIVPQALSKLPKGIQLEVHHQAGGNKLDYARSAYTSAGLMTEQYIVREFYTDMAAEYLWADLAICRAGALTIAELMHVGLGSILIPYQYAIGDHQRYNALELVNAKAAEMITQPELTAELLAKILLNIIQTPNKALTMAQNARKNIMAEPGIELVKQCNKYAPTNT